MTAVSTLNLLGGDTLPPHHYKFKGDDRVQLFEILLNFKTFFSQVTRTLTASYDSRPTPTTPS